MVWYGMNWELHVSSEDCTLELGGFHSRYAVTNRVGFFFSCCYEFLLSLASYEYEAYWVL